MKNKTIKICGMWLILILTTSTLINVVSATPNPDYTGTINSITYNAQGQSTSFTIEDSDGDISAEIPISEPNQALTNQLTNAKEKKYIVEVWTDFDGNLEKIKVTDKIEKQSSPMQFEPIGELC